MKPQRPDLNPPALERSDEPRETIAVPASLAPEVRAMVARHVGRPLPLDYPPNVAPRRPLVSVPALVCLLVLLGVLTFAFVFVVPTFKGIFADFKIELPAVTVALLALADVFNRPYVWPFAWLGALRVPFLIPRLARRRDGARGSAAVTTTLMVLLILAVAFFVAAALFMPMVVLVQSISGGGRGR